MEHVKLFTVHAPNIHNSVAKMHRSSFVQTGCLNHLGGRFTERGMNNQRLIDILEPPFLTLLPTMPSEKGINKKIAGESTIVWKYMKLQFVP